MLPNNYQCEGQMTIFEYFQESQFGRTSQEPSAQIVEKTSDAYLKNWQELKTPKFQYLNLKSGCHVDVSNFLIQLSHGEPTTLNIGESPNPAEESHLSWILETNPDPKYNLSSIACQGILRRAAKSGKKLPELLEKVLIQQSVSKNEPENLGGVKESSFSKTKSEQCQPQTIKPLCIGGGQVHDAISPSETCKTLNTLSDPMKVIAPCYALDRASFNQGKNAKYDISIKEDVAQTLVSRGAGGVMQTR